MAASLRQPLFDFVPFGGSNRAMLSHYGPLLTVSDPFQIETISKSFTTFQILTKESSFPF